jgi:ribosomal protein S18 acetylase RimI-like enzyme
MVETRVQEYTIRPYRRGEEHKMAELVNMSRLGEADVVVTVNMIRDEWADPRLTLDQDTWAAVDAEGQYLAVAEVWFGEADYDSDLVLRHVGFSIRPELRDSHRELMEELFSLAMQHAMTRPFSHPDKEYALRAWSSALDPWKNQWLVDHGFQLVHIGYTMIYDNLDELPQVAPVDGIHFEPRTPQRDEELRRAVNEAFSTDPSFTPLSGLEWDYLFTSDPAEFSNWLLAIETATDRVVGFTIAEIDQQINQELGRRDGWVMDLAVIPAWRGRRIGRALVSAAMQMLRDEGMTVIKMGVDADYDFEQATRLHESLGFRIQKGSHTYHRPITQ